nr:MAG TPA: hypothetical protein [Bacteriophage sp.]
MNRSCYRRTEWGQDNVPFRQFLQYCEIVLV